MAYAAEAAATNKYNTFSFMGRGLMSVAVDMVCSNSTEIYDRQKPQNCWWMIVQLRLIDVKSIVLEEDS